MFRGKEKGVNDQPFHQLQAYNMKLLNNIFEQVE